MCWKVANRLSIIRSARLAFPFVGNVGMLGRARLCYVSRCFLPSLPPWSLLGSVQCPHVPMSALGQARFSANPTS